VPHENFIGGAWKPAATGATDKVLNPATGEVIAQVPSSDATDADAAVAVAADAIEANLDDLKQIEVTNVGKPVSIIDFEFDLTVDNLRFFAGAARTLQAQAAGEYLEGYTSMLRRDPLGVCVGIAPWNYPLNMATWKLGPALAAGNTFILKPSELTPLTALRLAEISADIFPPGVFNVVCGQGEQVGDAFVRHPGVAMVSLTGDVETGKLIARNAADSLKRVHLELGGKAPVLVFDDADVEALVGCLAENAYYNTGQDCTAPCRVVAGPGVYDRLLGDLGDAVGGLAVGDPTVDDTAVGPLVSAAQRERVAGMVSRSVEAGAEVVTGGEAIDGPGFYYRGGEPGTGFGAGAARGVRPGGERPALQRRGPGTGLGQRGGLWPRRQRVDPRRRPCDAHVTGAAVRHRVGQRPHPPRVGVAPRRVQAERLRQGHVALRGGALHRAQARDGQSLIPRGPRSNSSGST
jgi:acyl-CoA reductase-like NAD-dependent aldehyde dehydrogenase